MAYVGTPIDFTPLQKAGEYKAQMEENKPSFAKGVGAGINTGVDNAFEQLKFKQQLFQKTMASMLEKGEPVRIAEDGTKTPLDLKERAMAVAYAIDNKELPPGIMLDNSKTNGVYLSLGQDGTAQPIKNPETGQNVTTLDRIVKPPNQIGQGKKTYYLDQNTKELYESSIGNDGTAQYVKATTQPGPGDIVKALQFTPEQRVRQSATRDFNAYQADLLTASNALNELTRATKELGDFERGLLGQGIAKAEILYGKYSADPKVVNYFGTLSQILIPAARKLMEEKGPITESDVARVEQGLGDASLPMEDKIKLIEQFRSKLMLALQAKAEASGMSVNDIKSKYPTLYDSIYNTKQNMAQRTQSTPAPASGATNSISNMSDEELLKALGN